MQLHAPLVMVYMVEQEAGKVENELMSLLDIPHDIPFVMLLRYS
jgi:hypothetical protein